MSLVLAGFPQAGTPGPDGASRALHMILRGKKGLMGEAPPWWRKDGEMSTGAAPHDTSGLNASPARTVREGLRVGLGAACEALCTQKAH